MSKDLVSSISKHCQRSQNLKPISMVFQIKKRICSYDQEKTQPIICAEIETLTDQEQADKIAQHFSAVRQKFKPLEKSDIIIPPFSEDTIPQFTE